MVQKKKLSILEQIAAAEDVAEELMEVPEWGVSILFRGMSLAALEALQGADMQAAAAGDMAEVMRMLQATACDPETKLPLFVGEAGLALLRTKHHEVLIRLLNEGSFKVLGIDAEETAGKG